MQKEKLGGRLRILIAAAIILGIFFRLYNIDHKIFWFDETITSHLISGYTNWEMMSDIRDRLITPSQLEAYYALSPRGIKDTYAVALREDLHPPLYYLLTRLWAGLFRPSPSDTVVVVRFFSVALSFISFPLLAWLCWELFGSRKTALVALALFALSPFQVLYAQEARVYSLWTAAILLSSVMVVRAARTNSAASWTAYFASAVLCLYTHLFSIPLLLGHGVFVLSSEGILSKGARYYAVSALAALACLAPWIAYLYENPGLMSGATGWVGAATSPQALIALWGRGLAGVFFDLDISLGNVRYLLAPYALVILLVFYIVRFFFKNSPARARSFILSSMLASVLPLLGPDLVLGGLRSTVPRYLAPFYLCVQICVAYSISANLPKASKPARGQRMWAGIFIIILLSGLVSLVVSSQATVWWNKYLTVDFSNIRAVLGASERPLLISDDNPGVVYSLTRGLSNKTGVVILGEPKIPFLPGGFTEAFAYNPSDPLRENLMQQYALLEVPGCRGLYRINPKS